MRGVYFVASDCDLAILDRGRAREVDGSDNFCHLRRGEMPHSSGARTACLGAGSKARGALSSATAIEPYCVLSNLCNITIWPVLSMRAIAMPQLFSRPPPPRPRGAR